MGGEGVITFKSGGQVISCSRGAAKMCLSRLCIFPYDQPNMFIFLSIEVEF